MPGLQFPGVFDWMFGDGSDGDVTISGTTTLARGMYYNNLTINGPSGLLQCAGYQIFVKGQLTINSGGRIRANLPGSGGSTSNNVPGAGGAGASSAYLGSGAVGGSGGSNAVGNPGAVGEYGGAGGNGGSSFFGPGVGGTTTQGVSTPLFGNIRVFPLSTFGLRTGPSGTVRADAGAGGGGGGGLSVTTAGAGGGGGGGVIAVAARKILIADANQTPLYAPGGAGGSATLGGGGTAAGGGGGGGGAILLAYGSLVITANGPLAPSVCAPGGAGGGGITAGLAGGSGIIWHFPL